MMVNRSNRNEGVTSPNRPATLPELAELHTRRASQLLNRAGELGGIDRENLVRRAEAHALIGASLARAAAVQPKPRDVSRETLTG